MHNFEARGGNEFSAWLRNHFHGPIAERDREAISQFLILWTLFEFRFLNSNANASAIVEQVNRWHSDGRLRLDAYQSALAYFRNRYCPDGRVSHFFDLLHLRGNDRPELVEAVIKGGADTPAEIVSVLLIIVYRIRNNLFHGLKWIYGLRNEYENFLHANSLLMTIMDQVGTNEQRD